MRGTNIALLTRLPFDAIKLDRALIAQIQPDAAPADWLQALGSLLATNRINVIAEDVETQLQADVLREAGVRAGQGHLFSRPLPAADFMRFRSAPA